MKEYIYLGDKITDHSLKGKDCNAIRRDNGKCIRGRNGSMLVEFEGVKVNIIGKRLRKKVNTDKCN